MARLEHSSQNLLEIKYRAMTKLDVLGRGWGVCWGVETGQFVEECSYESVPAPEPRKLQKGPDSG